MEGFVVARAVRGIVPDVEAGPEVVGNGPVRLSVRALDGRTWARSRRPHPKTSDPGMSEIGPVTLRRSG